MEAGKYRAFQVRLNLRSEPRTKLVAKTPNPQILARVSLLASHERLREKRLCLVGVQAIKSRFFAPIYRKYLYILSYPVFLYYAESPKVPPRVFGSGAKNPAGAINLHMLKGFLASAEVPIFSRENSTIAFGEVNTMLFITVSAFHG